jgi:hypothetical protein
MGSGLLPSQLQSQSKIKIKEATIPPNDLKKGYKKYMFLK